MKKMKSVLLLLVMMLFAVSSVFAAPVPLEQTGQTSRVAWDQGVIEAFGTGVPPANAISMAQGRALSRRAAIVEAYRNLAEAIQGVQVDSETVMNNLAITNDTIKTQVSGLVRGAKIIREQAMADGSYQVVMAINLYGNDGLAGVALNAIRPERIQEFPSPAPGYNLPVANSMVNDIPADKTTIPMPLYTGVIIDARGLGLQSTFSPRVYDETGTIVYGNKYIDTDYAISQGMVEYTISPDMVQAAEIGQSRAGARPLIIKALKIIDANDCNLVISNADANAMLAANQSAGFLKKCAVVFER